MFSSEKFGSVEWHTVRQFVRSNLLYARRQGCQGMRSTGVEIEAIRRILLSFRSRYVESLSFWKGPPPARVAFAGNIKVSPLDKCLYLSCMCCCSFVARETQSLTFMRHESVKTANLWCLRTNKPPLKGADLQITSCWLKILQRQKLFQLLQRKRC